MSLEHPSPKCYKPPLDSRFSLSKFPDTQIQGPGEAALPYMASPDLEDLSGAGVFPGRLPSVTSPEAGMGRMPEGWGLLVAGE